MLIASLLRSYEVSCTDNILLVSFLIFVHMGLSDSFKAPFVWGDSTPGTIPALES
jgi:hypothetical protein